MSGASPLARKLGFFSAAMVVVSSMVGGGVFLNPTLVARILHAPGLILSAWALGGVLALAGAFVFSELSTVLPYAGGEYAFLREAFHPFVGFLYGWTLLFVIGAGAVAVMAVGISTYVVQLLHWPAHLSGALALALVLALSAYHALGIRAGVVLVNVITSAKLLVLGALIVAALAGPASGSAVHPSPFPEPGGFALGSSMLAALVPVMYAYSGWEKLGYIAEEVIDPVRTLPRALLVGVALVIGIYLASNAAYLHVLGAGGLAASDTPALAVAAATWGERGRRLLGVMVIASMFSTLNLTLMTTPRVYYAMARDGLFFRSLGRISPRFQAPTVAILLQGSVGGLLAAAGTYGRLVDYKVLGDWVFLSLCGVALLRLRRKLPDAARPIPVPFYPFTPLALSAAGALMVANALVTNPWHTAQGFAVIALGVPAFFLWWRAPTGA